MAQSKEERRRTSPLKEDRRQGGSSLPLGMAPVMFNPIMTIFAELNATVLESFAAAQMDWAAFVQRRVKEDVVVSRQLLNCQSLADMHQVYAQYLRTAFEQYREQSEQVVQRSASMAQHLTEATEREVAITRH
jgi:hypothetical protein